MPSIQTTFQDDNVTQLVKHAKIDAASSGNNTLVAAVKEDPCGGGILYHDRHSRHHSI